MSNNEDTALIVRDESVQLGTLQLSSPADVIHQASTIAAELAKIIKDRSLSRKISNKEYVYVEGWSTMGAMMGLVAREAPDSPPKLTVADDGYEEYEATAEIVRMSDGAIVGRASAIVGTDEQNWQNRPRNARRSMALTRATGKAFRLGFSWIMQLAGYAATPAEEMDAMDAIEGEFTDAPTQSKPKRKTTTKKPNGNGSSWNPVTVLVEAGICENVNAASGLLNAHVPKDIISAKDKDALIAWGKRYRGWRDLGSEPEAAADNATQEIDPK